MPFFSRYGKLSTGLQRLELESDPLPADRNHGLQPLQPLGSKSAPTKERPNSFGQTPSVPWLDALQKERALEILEAEAANQMEVC
jgi:hypothetical protein